MLYAAQKYVSGSTLFEAPLRIGLAALVVVSLSANASGQSEQDGVCSAIAVPGAMSVTAEGINNAGVVVGSYTTSDWVTHGYIYSAGQITTLDAPDSYWTAAFGINDAGVVVGVYGPVTQPCQCVYDIEVHGFRYSNGAFTTFDVGLSETWPMAINNAGTIVGFYNDRDGDIEDAKRGFLLSAGGGLTRIDGPGGGPLTEVATYIRGINDNGVAVGFYGGGFALGGPAALGAGAHGFTWRDGVLTELRHPEAPENTWLYGIDNDEKIVGVYAPDANSIEGTGFTFANSRFSKFDCVDSTEAPPQPEPDPELPAFGPSVGASLQPSSPGKANVNALNNRGGMVGNRVFANGMTQAFSTRPITFVDPIPELAPPGETKVTVGNETVATRGRVVQGIAADGVSQIVVRIPVASAGVSVTVTVYKSKTQSIEPGDTGAYGTVGTLDDVCFGKSCEVTNVTVASVYTTARGPMAFVVYRAPLDFARSPADAGLAYRDVYLRVEGSSGSTVIPLKVIRPPVALVHGLWSDPSMWDNFGPYANSDPRFAFYPVDYGGKIHGRLVSMEPFYIHWWGARASALGVDFNARSVFPQIYRDIDIFKNGKNPVGLPVAAIQADFVVHSLGGLITRYLPRVVGFKRYTMGHGVVHKLITIDTPHIGSPLATRFIQQIENPFGTRCFQTLLGLPGNLVVKSARLTMEPRPVNGAAFDLAEGSAIVMKILQQDAGAIPTALIAGTYTSWFSLDMFGSPARFIRRRCPGDDIAQSLTPTGWPTLMNGSNDAMVTLASQKAGVPNPPLTWFDGMAHSNSLLVLGFIPPYVTTHFQIANEVIDLLNTPFTAKSRYLCLPQGPQCGQ